MAGARGGARPRERGAAARGPRPGGDPDRALDGAGNPLHARDGTARRPGRDQSADCAGRTRAGAGVAGRAEFPTVLAGDERGRDMDGGQRGEAAGDVECFGYGWENGAVDAGDIPRIFRDSVISLNFANSKGENQIKARTFEVPGSGGFLITDNARNLSLVFDDRQEIVVVNSIEEMANSIKKFTADYGVRDEIAYKGFLKVQNKYSYARRVADILDFAAKLERNKDKNQAIDFAALRAGHRLSVWLKLFRFLLVGIGKIVFGKDRGLRFARRACFEFEWRVRGAKTYGYTGWTGRMFYGH